MRRNSSAVVRIEGHNNSLDQVVAASGIGNPHLGIRHRDCVARRLDFCQLGHAVAGIRIGRNALAVRAGEGAAADRRARCAARIVRVLNHQRVARRIRAVAVVRKVSFCTVAHQRTAGDVQRAALHIHRCRARDRAAADIQFAIGGLVDRHFIRGGHFRPFLDVDYRRGLVRAIGADSRASRVGNRAVHVQRRRLRRRTFAVTPHDHHAIDRRVDRNRQRSRVICVHAASDRAVLDGNIASFHRQNTRARIVVSHSRCQRMLIQIKSKRPLRRELRYFAQLQVTQQLDRCALSSHLNRRRQRSEIGGALPRANLRHGGIPCRSKRQITGDKCIETISSAVQLPFLEDIQRLGRIGCRCSNCRAIHDLCVGIQYSIVVFKRHGMYLLPVGDLQLPGSVLQQFNILRNDRKREYLCIILLAAPGELIYNIAFPFTLFLCKRFKEGICRNAPRYTSIIMAIVV